MEFGQIFVPGRHSALFDALAGVLGATVGCVLTMMFDLRARAYRL